MKAVPFNGEEKENEQRNKKRKKERKNNYNDNKNKKKKNSGNFYCTVQTIVLVASIVRYWRIDRADSSDFHVRRTADISNVLVKRHVIRNHETKVCERRSNKECQHLQHKEKWTEHQEKWFYLTS